MKKVLCFGELLLRVSPSPVEDAEKNPFILYMGGTEAMVFTTITSRKI
jgi:2-dehydro-3-deoxygluconokinase